MGSNFKVFFFFLLSYSLVLPQALWTPYSWDCGIIWKDCFSSFSSYFYPKTEGVKMGNDQLLPLLFFCLIFFCFGHAYSIHKFPGQGWNLSHKSDNTESLTARPPGNSTSFLFSCNRVIQSGVLQPVATVSAQLTLQEPCLRDAVIILLSSPTHNGKAVHMASLW